MRRVLSKIKLKIIQRIRLLKPANNSAQSNPSSGAKGKNTQCQAAAGPFAAGLAEFGLQRKTTSSSLQITLKNQTNSANVYAYITGLAIEQNNAVFLLQADGQTPYFPASPTQNGTPLAVNCAIVLGPPGNSVNVTIPYIAGGRIWFSVDSPLTFLLNPGPGLVEPSVTNTSDPNYNINWAFAEFTYNSSQMYANISFVDFVSLPISLSLTNTSGNTNTVPGLPSGGLSNICNQLRAQTSKDGVAGWSNLIVNSASGQPLRALSPNNGLVLRPADFANYFDAYVQQVFSTYATTPISVQINSGTYSGETNTGSLMLGSEQFSPPSTADIFSCSTGPFATGGDVLRNTLIPQLAAAFNRSTLLTTNQMPSPLSTFYQYPVTNHYSRIVHDVVTNGKGYAFPYDDVPPSSGGDQSGYVSDGAPVNMTVAVSSL